MMNYKLLANALRFLSVDAIENANSGHPGMPLGMADIATVLWQSFMRHNPHNPKWHNRDRFVLSNGHGCMLLYALLHLTGYDLTIDDLKKFRQLHSKTPGHPELGITPGVETTTGPLGQGLANAVGMAIAEQHLAATYNRQNFTVIDHYVYAFVGDGCLMEGISHEVCSLAGALKLGKLIVFYDDNGISIDGQVNSWYQDNTPLRFQAYGWHVIPKVSGHDSQAIATAIREAQAITNQPSLICCQTIIGYGAPNKAGSNAVHGSALGASEITAMRQHLNWPYPEFVIPAEIYHAWDKTSTGSDQELRWQKLFNSYQEAYPKLAAELTRRWQQKLPENWPDITSSILTKLSQQTTTMATRQASKICLEHYAPLLPELFGGSADLTESNGTLWEEVSIFNANNSAGRYLHYGVREFGMSAIMNGMAAYGGIMPYGGTFLVFSDYARNAIRMAALMRLKNIFIYTHDSIALGEDGATHQPIEQLPSLRLIPNLSIWRPCDLMETAVAWQAAITNNGPTCLVLSRQKLPQQERSDTQILAIPKGGYVLRDYTNNNMPHLVIIATGSEVELAINAAIMLQQDKIYCRVVSMPSVDTFLAQDQQYQAQILPPLIPRIIIEAAASNFWHQFINLPGTIIGVDQFGVSAPAADIYKNYNLTLAHIIATIKNHCL